MPFRARPLHLPKLSLQVEQVLPTASHPTKSQKIFAFREDLKVRKAFKWLGTNSIYQWNQSYRCSNHTVDLVLRFTTLGCCALERNPVLSLHNWVWHSFQVPDLAEYQSIATCMIVSGSRSISSTMMAVQVMCANLSVTLDHPQYL